MKKPLFITVEGGEGVGKSHFVSGLAEAMRRSGINVKQTREPGGTKIADRIREVFVAPPADEPISPVTELCLISGARAQHVSYLINPTLSDNVTVLCDRFIDSTRVYQGRVGGIAANKIERMIVDTTGGLEPDITFLLDCPVETSLKRLAKRGEADSQESSRYDQAVIGVHQAIRKAFLELAEQFTSRIRVVDATDSPEQMVANAMAVLKEWQHAQPE